MHDLILLLSFLSTVLSQYAGQSGIQPDVGFDDRNDRFNVDEIVKSVGSYKPNVDAEDFRRRKTNPMQKLADRIRAMAEGKAAAIAAYKKERQPIKNIDNPILKAIHARLKEFRSEFESKMMKVNQSEVIEEEMSNRLVNLASNGPNNDIQSNVMMNAEEINDNIDGNAPKVPLEEFVLDEEFNREKDVYEKYLKKFESDNKIEANRRIIQDVVNSLHEERNRRSTGNRDNHMAVEDLLMHYAFPLKVKLYGYLRIPSTQ